MKIYKASVNKVHNQSISLNENIERPKNNTCEKISKIFRKIFDFIKFSAPIVIGAVILLNSQSVFADNNKDIMNLADWNINGNGISLSEIEVLRDNQNLNMEIRHITPPEKNSNYDLPVISPSKDIDILLKFGIFPQNQDETIRAINSLPVDDLIKFKNSDDLSLLQFVILNDKSEVALAIIKKIGITNQGYYYSQFNKEKNTALHLVLINENLKVASELTRVMGIEAFSKQNSRGETPLYLAVKKGYELARQIIKQMDPKDIGKADMNSVNPLFIAALYGYENIMNDLIDKMNPEDISKANRIGDTALHMVADKDKVNKPFININTVKKLISKMSKESILMQGNYNGVTAMHFAVLNKNFELVKEIYNAVGSEAFGIQDKNGYTPFHLSVDVSTIDICSFISNKISDKDRLIKNKNGNTASDLIAELVRKKDKNLFNKIYGSIV